MRFGLRLPSFALGPDTASLATMGAYLRRAEDLGFELGAPHRPPAHRTPGLSRDVAGADHAPRRALGRDPDDATRHPRARAAVPRPGPPREGVGDARCPVRRTDDPRRGGRLARGRVRGPADSSSRARPPDGRAPGRADRAVERRACDLSRPLLRLRGPPDRAPAGPTAAPAHLDRGWHAAAASASTSSRSTRSGPSSSGSPAMPTPGCRTRRRPPRWSAATGRSSRRRWFATVAIPHRCRACTRTSCMSSRPARRPNPLRRGSGRSRAWTSTTGSRSTCWARPSRSPSASGGRSRRSAGSTRSS